MAEPTERIRHEILKGVGGFFVLLVVAGLLGGAARGIGNEMTSWISDGVSVFILIMHVNRASKQVALARIVAGRELLKQKRPEEALEVLLPFGHGFNKRFDKDREALNLIKEARKKCAK